MRHLKSLQDQLRECRQQTEKLQIEWSTAENHLIALAMARDNQMVEEQRIREGSDEIKW